MPGVECEKNRCGMRLTRTLFDSNVALCHFAHLIFRRKLYRPCSDAGYTEPTPIQIAAIPLILRRTRYHRHRADGHGKDSRFRSADSNEARRIETDSNAGV